MNPGIQDEIHVQNRYILEISTNWIQFCIESRFIMMNPGIQDEIHVRNRYILEICTNWIQFCIKSRCDLRVS
jgi:hypothetical protein